MTIGKGGGGVKQSFLCARCKCFDKGESNLCASIYELSPKCILPSFFRFSGLAPVLVGVISGLDAFELADLIPEFFRLVPTFELLVPLDPASLIICHIWRLISEKNANHGFISRRGG